MERLVVQGDDGTPIGTATVGSGSTAVVLVHGSGQDLCDWLWFVPRLVDLGVTVVPYDLRGRGSSSGAKGAVEPLPGDLAAVVDAARAGGAERVVLVGTSLGAATALVAAGRIDPPVDAVVAVSPPGRLGGVAVADAATSYDGPVYLVVAKDDDGYPATVRDLATALPGAKPPIVLDGSDHGLRLVQARPDDVAAAIEQAVRDGGRTLISALGRSGRSLPDLRSWPLGPFLTGSLAGGRRGDDGRAARPAPSPPLVRPPGPARRRGGRRGRGVGTLASCAATVPERLNLPFGDAQQLIVVTAPTWSSTSGSLTTYEKVDGHWRIVQAALAGPPGPQWLQRRPPRG